MDPRGSPHPPIHPSSLPFLLHPLYDKVSTHGLVVAHLQDVSNPILNTHFGNIIWRYWESDQTHILSLIWRPLPHSVCNPYFCLSVCCLCNSTSDGSLLLPPIKLLICVRRRTRPRPEICAQWYQPHLQIQILEIGFRTLFTCHLPWIVNRM